MYVTPAHPLLIVWIRQCRIQACCMPKDVLFSLQMTRSVADIDFVRKIIAGEVSVRYESFVYNLITDERHLLTVSGPGSK